MRSLAVLCTGVQIKVTMKHLKTSVPDSSSCESDIDRQELIDNYGSEKYLSKWNDDNDDGLPQDVIDEKSEVHKQSNEDFLAEYLHCLTTDHDDDASLVSYNSVRDAGGAVKRDTQTASYLPYQIQSPTQHITLWQGYGGNIYFDPVRCQSMRINSSRPIKQKSKDGKNYRQTKSCSPSMEVLSGQHYTSSSASSFHSLGSLRFASRDEKRKKTASFPQHGKIYKGFSDGKVKENSVTGHHHHVRCESAPESLVISGGHFNDVTTDPIDGVLKHNINTRFISKNKDGFPRLVIGHKWNIEKGRDKPDSQSEWCTNLPPVESLVPSKELAEPKPVFIIPFGALDDPVELHNNTNMVSEKTKRNVIKKKPSVKAEILNEVDDVSIECPSNESRLSFITSTAEKSGLDQQNLMQKARVSDNSAVIKSQRSTTVRQQISNSSLSNYLQAIPTNLSENISNQQKRMPKLSYTKRNNDAIPDSLQMNSSSDICTSDIRVTTNALYGGYLPSTRVTDTKLFHAELSSPIKSEVSETESERSREYEQRKSYPKRPVKRNSTKNMLPRHPQDTDKCHLPVVGWKVS